MPNRWNLTRSVAVLAIALLVQGCAPSMQTAVESQRAAVVKVTDGDTIRVLLRGVSERVRLIGVDTPEVPWYDGTGECFGVEAAKYLERRASRRTVRLVFDLERRDRYGRLLAYVYIGPELVNLTLVRLGLATADPVRPNTRFAAAFARAESGARAHGRGLWSACRG